MEQLGSHCMDFHESWYLSSFFENWSRQFRFHQNLTITTGPLHEYKCVYIIMSQSLLLKWEIFQTNVLEKINTHFLFKIFPPPRKSYRLGGNGRVGQATDDNIIRRMRKACWIPKATNTHSECVILIAFPQQQLLHEIAWVLYMYSACFAKTFMKEGIYTATRV
jgi:hypothetical protein